MRNLAPFLAAFLMATTVVGAGIYESACARPVNQILIATR